MDSKSQFTVDIISKVIDGKITINSATQLLKKSRRTVERYLRRYRKEGIRFVIHGNTGRAPINKMPDSLKKEVQRKLEALELVEQLGSITKAARILGCSRQTLYTYQQVMEEEGPLGLKRINKPLKRSKNRIPEHVENKIIELTLLNPHGTAIQLMKVLKEHDITVSITTIQNIWKREQLNTRELRVKRSQSMNIEV